MKDEAMDYHASKQSPLELLSYVDKFVLIDTKFKSSINGYIEAIDPISESIILTKYVNNKYETVILMGHTISAIQINQPPEGWKKRIVPEITQESLEYTNEKKQAIQKWLAKNLLPVEDVDGILQVHSGQLSITPPYGPDDCVSNNSIILGRIQHLLSNMPKVNESC